VAERQMPEEIFGLDTKIVPQCGMSSFFMSACIEKIFTWLAGKIKSGVEQGG
jgi:hypothetical protein